MYAIVPAAGSGIRMGEERPKILLPVGDHGLILELTLRALRDSEVVTAVVLAVRPQDIEQVRNLTKRVVPELEAVLVAGGETRQDSVYQALREVTGRTEYVLVHDAARPLCDPHLIRQAAECCQRTSACLLAVPVKPTLKRSKNRIVKETVSREDMWEAQTPQAFSFSLLMQAHEQARVDKYCGTDDCELVERLGHQVHMVQGSYRNIKITTPDDLAYAKFLLDSL